MSSRMTPASVSVGFDHAARGTGKQAHDSLWWLVTLRARESFEDREAIEEAPGLEANIDQVCQSTLGVASHGSMAVCLIVPGTESQEQ